MKPQSEEAAERADAIYQKKSKIMIEEVQDDTKTQDNEDEAPCT